MLTGYCQKNKETLQKKACERYQNTSEEQKSKKCQYDGERKRNLLENEKERQGYSRMQKNDSFINDKRLLHEIRKIVFFVFYTKIFYFMD